MATTLYDYPFWGPWDNGPARDISKVSEPIGDPQLKAIEEDSVRLKVPQETGWSNEYADVWQQAPVIIPTPQAPVQVQEQFARADSLLAYAMMTLGAQMSPGAQNNAALGNVGKEHMTNG